MSKTMADNGVETGLMARLGMFRPSDKAALQAALLDSASRARALDAVREFVTIWENADWLEAYSIERIGKWIGKTLPPEIGLSLSAWSQENPSEARAALLNGLKAGLAQDSLAM
nr:hypothetical protein [uncultured Gellertiella sp.]